MGQEQELTLEQINRVAKAVELIGEEKLIDGRISYRVGLLGDYCVTPLKGLEKVRTKLITKFNEDRTEIVGEDEEQPTAKINHKVTMLANKLNEAVAELGENICKIKIPELKVADFLAKEDIKQTIKVKDKDGIDRNEVITIKAGQALVPVKFFTLMGDLIKE